MNFIPFGLIGCQSHDAAAFLMGVSAAYIVPIVTYVVYRLFLGGRGPRQG